MGVPNTVTQLSHAFYLTFANTVIASVTEWNPNQTRGTKLLYQFGTGLPGFKVNDAIGSVTAAVAPASVGGIAQIYGQQPGDPYERVPNNVTDLSVDLTRYELYSKPFEKLFGVNIITLPESALLAMLSAQLSAFDAIERWLKPDNTSFSNVYKGCWWESKGKRMTAEGERVVMTNARIGYTQQVYQDF